MEISQRQAKEVINTLTSVIHEDINFITPEGVIIASSDASRVGTFHEGATMVRHMNQPLIIASNDLYKGTKKGVNLPLYHEDQLIAVVGITGEPEEIIKFSKVIVKMSEILIKEHFMNVQKQFKRENQRVLLEMMMKEKNHPKIVIDKMTELGYNPEAYHYVAIFDVQNLNQKPIDDLNHLYNSIEKRLHKDDLLARHESFYVLLTAELKLEKLIDHLKDIKMHLEKKYQVKVTIGISEEIIDLNDFSQAFQQARMVVELGSNRGSGLIKVYERTSLDLLFQGFSNYLKMDFSSHVFKELNREEIEETRETILTYIRHNGSIQTASEELVVHKNTLQYRLNRIHQKTGYNPRNLEDLMALYLAIQLDKHQ